MHVKQVPRSTHFISYSTVLNDLIALRKNRSMKQNDDYMETASLNDEYTLIRETLHSSAKCSLVETSKCNKALITSEPSTLTDYQICKDVPL